MVLRKLLVSMLISSAALAAKPAPTRRVSVLIIPLDQASEAMAVKAESFANEAMSEFEGFVLKTNDELFGMGTDEEASAALKRAEQGFQEGKTDFDNQAYEDAERKLRATLKEYRKAAPAMKQCGHLCDATAMYAALMQVRGDLEEAKLGLLDLLALSAKFDLARKQYTPEFIKLRSQFETSQRALVRSSLNVSSSPSGARLFLNGEFQGYTPMALHNLPSGKVLVNFERPGFVRAGALVEMAMEDKDLNEVLVANAAYKSYDGLMDRLATEALKNRPGAAMSSVGKTLGLDRGIVGVMKALEGGKTVELSMMYVDFKKPARLAAKRTTLQGDEYGQLKGEVRRVLNLTINSAETPVESKGKSSDPLGARSGTEDWQAEDQGGRTTLRDNKNRTKKVDPLEGMNGTETW